LQVKICAFGKKFSILLFKEGMKERGKEENWKRLNTVSGNNKHCSSAFFDILLFS